MTVRLLVYNGAENPTETDILNYFGCIEPVAGQMLNGQLLLGHLTVGDHTLKVYKLNGTRLDFDRVWVLAINNEEKCLADPDYYTDVYSNILKGLMVDYDPGEIKDYYCTRLGLVWELSLDITKYDKQFAQSIRDKIGVIFTNGSKE